MASIISTFGGKMFASGLGSSVIASGERSFFSSGFKSTLSQGMVSGLFSAGKAGLSLTTSAISTALSLGGSLLLFVIMAIKD